MTPLKTSRAKLPTVRLRKALRTTIEAGHPWIWRDAVSDAEHDAGTVVRVVDDRGFIAIGVVERGPIAVRILSLRNEEIDDGFFMRRIERATELRAQIVPSETNAFRLVHGEGDGLPGIVIDIYDMYAVCQFDGSAAEHFMTAVVATLRTLRPGLRAILTRRGKRESKRVEVVWGAGPDGPIDVTERGMRLRADLTSGQKTGLFLDHRESRYRVRELCRGARVLNLYGYTGGFSVAAGLGGAAEVDTVDISPGAIEMARASWELNALPAERHRAHVSDVPEFLEEARRRDAKWDFIVADPPSFAPNEVALPAAIKSYRALHRACLRLLEPGGLYLAASCSSHVTRELFDKTLREASEKVAPVQILERAGAPADHPRLAAFPEGDYLKVVLARRHG